MKKKKVLSPEHCRKIALALTGKKLSPEHVESIRRSHIGKRCSPKSEFKKGAPSAFKGRSHTLTACINMSVNRSGSKSIRWKGGIRKNLGYVYIYSPFHPYRNAAMMVNRSRLVMEEHLGRYLLPHEVVHHINEKRDDDRIENLFLCDSSIHRKIHHGTYKIPCGMCEVSA